MKRTRLLILVYCTLACVLLVAQPASLQPPRFKWGFKFSSEWAGFRNYSMRLYRVQNGGIQSVIRLGKSNWSLETGLYFNTKIPELWNEKIKYRYLNLPLNIRYDKKGFYFSAGFFADYLVRCVPDQEFYNVNNVARNYGAGVNGAIGYERKIYRKINLLLEIRGMRNFFGYQSLYFISRGVCVGLNYSV